MLFSPEDAPLQNVDEISKRIRSDKGVLSICHKNFTDDSSLKKIKSEDIIDLKIVLTTLATINHVYCKELGFDSTERFKLSRITTQPPQP